MKSNGPWLVLITLGFSIGLAAFIGSRLNDQSVALLAGTLVGVLIALPIGGLAGWIARGQRAAGDRSGGGVPPAVVVPPPTYVQSTPAAAWQSPYPAGSMPQLPPRKYTIGGEEIVSHESDAVW